MSNPIIEARNERTKWFLEDRFGMFIHWGLYSIPARGEWLRNNERTTIEDYQQYFDEFDPIYFEPEKWARLAKEAGMKYAVLTAKHHDGFCLFDSKLTDYKCTNTKYGRDIVREYLEAFRKEGIKVGLYYSLLDWHHPDYPHFNDRIHPMRGNPDYPDEGRNWQNYIDYFHGQVRELLTDYGKLDIMWFDFAYDDMKGEKWQATKLFNMIRELQPHLITDNRIEGAGEYYGSIMTDEPEIYAGDFASPEQMIPPEGMCNVHGEPVPWEACITLNDHWGYCAHDNHYKSAKMVIRNLVECVSKNGNMLLNVGPNAKGEIPEKSVEILKEVGKWMRENSDSIYGCKKAQFPKPDWGRFTQKGNKLYAHVFDECINAVALDISPDKIEKTRLLCDNSEIKIELPWNAIAYPDLSFFTFGGKSFPLPDEKDTVVEITLK